MADAQWDTEILTGAANIFRKHKLARMNVKSIPGFTNLSAADKAALHVVMSTLRNTYAVEFEQIELVMPEPEPAPQTLAQKKREIERLEEYVRILKEDLQQKERRKGELQHTLRPLKEHLDTIWKYLATAVQN